MASPEITLEELRKHVGIRGTQLDCQCSDDHLLIIAKKIDNWMQYANALKLTGQDIESIRTDIDLNYHFRSLQSLKMWQRRYAFRATYRVLVDVCLNEGNAKLAEEICQLIVKG